MQMNSRKTNEKSSSIMYKKTDKIAEISSKIDYESIDISQYLIDG